VALIEELKRRRVFRVAAAYIVFSWAVLQAADIVIPAVPLPDWSMRLLLITLVVLFPAIVLAAWIFQITSKHAIRKDTHRTSPSMLIGVAVATFAIGGALGMFWSSVNSVQVETPVDRRPRVAVLPLKDMSPGGDKAYFSDGIHEELISRLAEIRSIAVPSRTSVDRYRKTDLSTRDIALELDVDYILEGSVRHSSDRILITLQMIDGDTDNHLWVQDFDRKLTVDNIFDIQKNVAQNVARLLRTQLAPGELQLVSRSPTSNIAAYEAVLKGVFHYRRYGREDLRLAIEYFEQATKLDPGFANAWSGLANTYMLAATTYGWMEPAKAIPLAKQYGVRALELDPYRGATISLIGDIAYWYDFDPIAAESKYREGIAIDPHHVGNRLSYSYLLSTQGRFDEAQVQIEYCLREEPNAANVLANRAWRYFDARQYEKAIESARTASKFDAGLPDPGWILGYSLVYLGRFDEAKKIPQVEENFIVMALMLVRSGQMDEARAYVAERHEQMLGRPANIAMLYAIIEDADEAFRWIDKAIEERHREILLLGTWELFDPLRSDPRFDAALSRIGFTG
jgi:adenylate cyclase